MKGRVLQKSCTYIDIYLWLFPVLPYKILLTEIGKNIRKKIKLSTFFWLAQWYADSIKKEIRS